MQRCLKKSAAVPSSLDLTALHSRGSWEQDPTPLCGGSTGPRVPQALSLGRGLWAHGPGSTPGVPGPGGDGLLLPGPAPSVSQLRKHPRRLRAKRPCGWSGARVGPPRASGGPSHGRHWWGLLTESLAARAEGAPVNPGAARLALRGRVWVSQGEPSPPRDSPGSSVRPGHRQRPVRPVGLAG